MEDIVCRPLTADDVPAAAALIAANLGEIPLFRWIMGDHVDDPAAAECIARVFLGGHVGLGRVEGAVHRDGRVLGAVVWTAPDEPSPPLPPETIAYAAPILQSRPDIVERQREMSAVTARHRPVGEFVEIVIGIVDPTLRRTGIPARLSAPARLAAVRLRLDALMTTSDKALGDAHERTHGAVFLESYPLGDVVIYSYRVPLSTSVDATTRYRPLTPEELADAVDLVGAMIPEIPLYRWILGEHLDEPETVAWLASVFVGPHLHLGRVQGAFDPSGRLLGLVAWSAPDLPPTELPASVEAESVRLLPSRPGIGQRLLALSEAGAANVLPGDHVLIVIGVVDPSVRRTGIPARLGEPARAAAKAAGMDVMLTTSDPALGRAHERTYGAVLTGEYAVGDVTVYQYAGQA